ncbi:DNA cytosine methyltransferase, partial [Streptacidiphilus melanogenes]|uniref:DNA cytosine methyltransferase n=1 Tax=Streptacidiphilus melanogenes TaxID=411235 RepID=UPI000A07B593
MGGSGPLTSIEICAGAGGQAAGLHRAGFRHLAMVEIDQHAAASLKSNVDRHADWHPADDALRDNDKKTKENFGRVLTMDVNHFLPFEEFPDLAAKELDLLAGGVPCPPFSLAGKQLGKDDERDLFPRIIELAEQLKPRALLIENVRGLLEPEYKFAPYRAEILDRLDRAGYAYCGWHVLEAADYGVPQLRPRALLVMIRKDCYRGFDWPDGQERRTTVFEALDASMQKRYGITGKAPWLDNAATETVPASVIRQRARDAYKLWKQQAKPAAEGVAPTLVGGSKKHGGADLGPTRAKRAWAGFGVNGLGVANDNESADVDRDLLGPNGPMLTVEQAAIIQGFPQDWEFTGGKTARYRQIGNAFPPPVAEAVGRAIAEALGRTGALLDPPTLP